MPDQPNSESHDLDSLLKQWPYQAGEVAARKAHASDGRPVLQLRVDLGVLQLEPTGRPDGQRPSGKATYLDYLRGARRRERDAFRLDADRCSEIDREFVQFYHRRVAWLALREFDLAVADADHTLALMDFSARHAPSEEWVELHEQYRPFVLFHRTQAEAMAELQRGEAKSAVAAIDAGLAVLDRALAGLAEMFGEDELELDEEDFGAKLRELRRSILDEYDLESSLGQQLAEAISHEQYELAAELRDRIAMQREQGAPRR